MSLVKPLCPLWLFTFGSRYFQRRERCDEVLRLQALRASDGLEDAVGKAAEIDAANAGKACVEMLERGGQASSQSTRPSFSCTGWRLRRYSPASRRSILSRRPAITPALTFFTGG